MWALSYRDLYIAHVWVLVEKNSENSLSILLINSLEAWYTFWTFLLFFCLFFFVILCVCWSTSLPACCSLQNPSGFWSALQTSERRLASSLLTWLCWPLPACTPGLAWPGRHTGKGEQIAQCSEKWSGIKMKKLCVCGLLNSPNYLDSLVRLSCTSNCWKWSFFPDSCDPSIQQETAPPSCRLSSTIKNTYLSLQGGRCLCTSPLLYAHKQTHIHSLWTQRRRALQRVCHLARWHLRSRGIVGEGAICCQHGWIRRGQVGPKHPAALFCPSEVFSSLGLLLFSWIKK